MTKTPYILLFLFCNNNGNKVWSVKNRIFLAHSSYYDGVSYTNMWKMPISNTQWKKKESFLSLYWPNNVRIALFQCSIGSCWSYNKLILLENWIFTVVVILKLRCVAEGVLILSLYVVLRVSLDMISIDSRVMISLENKICQSKSYLYLCVQLIRILPNTFLRFQSL